MSDPLIDELNACDRQRFTSRLGAIYEHSPWIAEQAWSSRPFTDRDALHHAMQEVLTRSPAERQDAVIHAHPDLGGRLARAGVLTERSQGEQAGLGLDALGNDEYERLDHFNRDYRDKFGFPFIIALRDQSLGSLIDAMATRLQNDRAEERAAALFQIGRIAWHRLHDL